MEVSVIIPTYKPGNYIWECLDSLTRQTLSSGKFEVIIVLNGCCEPWNSQVSEYIASKGLSNFCLLQTDEGGVSNARNIGIDKACGEYITFIDDDDFVSPSYLEALLAQSSSDAIVLSDSRAFIDSSRKEKKNYSPHLCYTRCANINEQSLLTARAIFNGPVMKLIPYDLMHGIRFDIGLSIGEDSLFMFQLSKDIHKLRYASPEAIYYRRFREGSAVTTIRPISFWLKNCVRLQLRFLCSWLKCPFKYNFPFVCSRILAPAKTIFKIMKGEVYR